MSDDVPWVKSAMCLGDGGAGNRLDADWFHVMWIYSWA